MKWCRFACFSSLMMAIAPSSDRIELAAPALHKPRWEGPWGWMRMAQTAVRHQPCSRPDLGRRQGTHRASPAWASCRAPPS